MRTQRQDRIARQIAARYGLAREYQMSRRSHLSPVEALEEWDLLRPEDYPLFEG